jgi:Endoribonuclease L-PSP
MDNLRGALAGVGAGFEHVVCVRIFLTDFERDYAAFNRLYTEYFEPDRLPARTAVRALISPEARAPRVVPLYPIAAHSARVCTIPSAEQTAGCATLLLP